ncbi:ubiquinol--cytochrome-c reductase subunit 8 [Geranomyces michiganensis]|nr:ubiquinol--cytochrome-c reductase subunit 8 [Geranomyces michiganensis]
MGHKWWGNMSHQQGFYEYGLSPFHQKTMKGFFVPGIFKFAKRTGRQLMFIGPPALVFFTVKGWAEKKFEYYNRKAYLMSPEHLAHPH